MKNSICLAVLISAALCAALRAQTTPIKINVDASEVSRRLIHATLQFPVQPGPLTLLYPEWLPGEHGPTGPVNDLAGMKITAGGKPVVWQRDPVNMYGFHLTVPPGATTLDVAIEFISPPESGGFSSGSSISSQLAVLNWNQFLLYPQGVPSDQLQVQASLKVPNGWRYGTALPIASESGNTVAFKPSSLTTLVDSPVQTGANYKTIDLGTSGTAHHYLHLAADSERATRMPDEEIAQFRNLVREANTLFGAHHYRDYHFLLTLSDHVAHFGLEHHESSDDRYDEDFVTDPDHRRIAADLLPHEMVHSWNGKFRRPAGLATADYSQPMKGDLLWVYEGLTEYYGQVLAARSGLGSVPDFMDTVAMQAARLDNQPGREWRPLSDTAVAAQLLYNARGDYKNLRRGVDFYDEGMLLWLDVDVTIRMLSKGAKSLDDFAKLWAGGAENGPEVKPYDFEEVVRTLNTIQPNDWAGFLKQRLESTSPRAPFGGITGGGYVVAYTAERSDYWTNREKIRKYADESYSLGLTVAEAGDISDIRIDSPAYKAGIAPSMKIIAVNTREFSLGLLRDTIADSAKTTAPIAILAKDGDYYKTFTIDYHAGSRYPRLQRDAAKPDLITAIIGPRAPR